MSFGFGVGDFLAIIKLVNGIRKDFIGAPKQLETLASEVRSLSIILQDVDVVLGDKLHEPDKEVELNCIAESCEVLFNDLTTFVHKFSSLKSDQKKVHSRARRIWDGFRFVPGDVEELQRRISVNVSLLNQATQSLLHDKVSKILRFHEDGESKKVLDWISSVDYVPQQNDLLSRRQQGTRRWLLESEEFQRWLGGRGETLFCRGIPGAGKTFTTSMTIEYLEDQSHDHRDVGIAYVYCNFRRKDQICDELLSSLLRSLVSQLPSIPEALLYTYRQHSRKGRRLSGDEALQQLISVVKGIHKAFIVIDALDELSGPDRRQVIPNLVRLKTSGVNLFVTSRENPEIYDSLGNSTSIEVRATKDDVRNYLDSHSYQFPVCVRKSPELQESIKRSIIDAVNGM